MCIKAIFFDMDGTLVHVPISSTEFLMNIYQELSLNFSLEQIAVARQRRRNGGIGNSLTILLGRGRPLWNTTASF